MMTFSPPPENLMSDAVVLNDHEMALGLIHREGDKAPSIHIWDGKTIRRIEKLKALAWAADIEASHHADAHKPVSEAMRNLVRRIDEIEAAAILRRAGREAMARFAESKAAGRA